MDINGIKKLMKMGLTIDDIVSLSPEDEEVKEVRKTTEKVEDKKDTGYEEILKSINNLTSAIQQSNLVNNSIDSAPKQNTIEDITKKIIKGFEEEK